MSLRLAKRVFHAPVDTSSAGDTTLVSAVTGRKVRVTSYVLVAAAPVTVEFKSGSTALSGAMPFGANGGASASGHPESPVLECAAGEALVITLGGAIQVSGHISYTLED